MNTLCHHIEAHGTLPLYQYNYLTMYGHTPLTFFSVRYIKECFIVI